MIAPDLKSGESGLETQRRPVADFRLPQFDGFQWRTETKKRQIAQWPVVMEGKAEFFKLRQHLLRVLGIFAGVIRLMRGVKRTFLEAQPFGLVVGFHLDAVLVSPEAKGVFNEIGRASCRE